MDDMQSPTRTSFRDKLNVAKSLAIENARRGGLRHKFVPFASQSSAIAPLNELQTGGMTSPSLPKEQSKSEAVDDADMSDPIEKLSDDKKRTNVNIGSSNPYASLTSAKKRRPSEGISDQHKSRSNHATGASVLENDDGSAEPFAERRRFGPSKKQRKRTQPTYESV